MAPVCRYLEALPAAIAGPGSSFRYSGRVRVVPLSDRPFSLHYLPISPRPWPAPEKLVVAVSQITEQQGHKKAT